MLITITMMNSLSQNWPFESDTDYVRGMTASVLIAALILLGPALFSGWAGAGLYKFVLMIAPICDLKSTQSEPLTKSQARLSKIRNPDKRLLTGSFLEIWNSVFRSTRVCSDFRQARLGFRIFLYVLTGFGLGALGLLALAVVGPHFVSLDGVRHAFETRYGYASSTAVLTAVILLTTLNSALEEFFYRGWLDGRIGVLASSLVFASQHVLVLLPIAGMHAALLAGLLLFAPSLLWSRMAKRQGLLAAWASHAAADATLFGGALFLLRWY